MIFPDWLTVHGDRSFRGLCPKETAEQVTFFAMVRKSHPRSPILHIRNEGIRTAYQISKEKSEGLITGAADIIGIGSPTLVIELKRKDHTKSKYGDGQLDFLYSCQNLGARVSVCLGHEAAYNEFLDWSKKNGLY